MQKGDAAAEDTDGAASLHKNPTASAGSELTAAIYSARTDIPVPLGTAVSGELSLAGELRAVPKIKSRIKTAANLGFTRVFTPAEQDNAQEVMDIAALIKAVFADA